ncbi:NAD(P)/FAD-dependent oxidoreductase [Spiroplasma sp. DGKH1]|uniref:NAD(P)/FAD-dependent oxidoreductase n=1 Tax=Spiroplasma sp. DGKH1 TaxID=3050074 RepID=UPI0034C63251
MKDILIIGAGPVGLYGWSCAGMLGLNGYIIEGNMYVGGQPIELYNEKEIYDIPGFLNIRASNFVDLLHQQALKNGNNIELMLETNIKKLTPIPDGFHVELTNNQIINVKTILITTGNGVFNPIHLEQLDPNLIYQNLSYRMENVNNYQNKKVVILGGGDSALDWANHLVEHNITTDVTIVHRRDLYRAKEASVQKLKANHIQELKPYVIKDIMVENNTVKELILTNTNDQSEHYVSADLFLVQYGSKMGPSIISSFDLEFDKLRKIKIQANGKTSNPRIFAAGNIASYEGKYYNMMTGFGECINSLVNITKVLYGEKYHPGYLGQHKK